MFMFVFQFIFQDKILPRTGICRMTSDPDEEPNFVSLLMADGLRRRTVSNVIAHDKSSIPTQNVVNYAPSRDNQLKYHGLNQFGQIMVIRLFIDHDGDEHYGEYIDLCIMKYSPANGLLEVSPDFTRNRKPYTIELEHRKETLEVWIEHVSPGNN